MAQCEAGVGSSSACPSDSICAPFAFATGDAAIGRSFRGRPAPGSSVYADGSSVTTEGQKKVVTLSDEPSPRARHPSRRRRRAPRSPENRYVPDGTSATGSRVRARKRAWFTANHGCGDPKSMCVTPVVTVTSPALHGRANRDHRRLRRVPIPSLPPAPTPLHVTKKDSKRTRTTTPASKRRDRPARCGSSSRGDQAEVGPRPPTPRSTSIQVRQDQQHGLLVT